MDGLYDQVYAYDAEDGTNPWKGHRPGLPSYANELTEMEPGAGYWIHATADCTLYLPLVEQGATPTPTPASDGTPPAAIQDLSVTSGYVLQTLTWTAPGDDGSVGTAAAYDVRYSDVSITEENWPTATEVTVEPTPAASGTEQSVSVGGLSGGATYYFAVKTSDEAGNQSALSNLASGSLPPPPPNLLSNGTFEDGTLDGWIGGTAEASTAEAHTGDWSAQVTCTYWRTLIDTTPGEEYKVIAWIKIVSETGSDWGGFRVEACSWDWVSLAHSGSLLTSSHGSEWFKVALSFEATTTGTFIQWGTSAGPGGA